MIDFAAVSLLSPGELAALQPARFSLASLSFNSLALGTSSLTFSQTIVADAFGNTLDVSARDGSVNVVPESSSFLLFASVLAAAIVIAWCTSIRIGRAGRVKLNLTTCSSPG